MPKPKTTKIPYPVNNIVCTKRGGKLHCILDDKKSIKVDRLSLVDVSKDKKIGYLFSGYNQEVISFNEPVKCEIREDDDKLLVCRKR